MGGVTNVGHHLAGFGGAPPSLLQLERELVATVDLLFSGGASLQPDSFASIVNF